MPQDLSYLGPHFVLGLTGTTLEKDEAALLKKVKPAGIILFAHNIEQGDNWNEKLRALVDNARNCIEDENLLVSIDHEGGRVHRLQSPVTHFPPARKWADRAEEVARRIERAYSSLSTLPHRGNYPRELLELGNRTFREVHFKPYRIVYRVLEREVVVLIVADGRRDMHALMARRLFGA